MKKGLLMLYTGSPTGAAAMALGQAFRAVGRGFRICFIRFGGDPSAFERVFHSDPYREMVEFHQFDKKSIDSEAVTTNAAGPTHAWELARKAIASGEFRMVVLEGIIDLLKSNSLDEGSVEVFLSARPADLHVIATGLDAPKSLIDAADLVTEVLETDQHRANG
jgi:cob(I)alamin adenosyltransferase